MAFSPDGGWLASGGSDRTVRIWEVATGREVHVLPAQGAGVCDVAWSPDGSLVAAGSNDRTVKVFDPARGREIITLTGHYREACRLLFSADGKTLYVYDRLAYVHGWDTSTWKHGQPLRVGTAMWVPASWVSTSRQTLLAVRVDNQTLNIHELPSGKLLRSLKVEPRAQTSPPFSGFLFTPDAARLIVAYSGGSFQVWDTHTWRARRLADKPKEAPPEFFLRQFVLIGDGSQALLEQGGDVYLYDVTTGERIRTLPGQGRQVWVLKASRNGALVATSTRYHTIELRELATWRVVRTLGTLRYSERDDW